MEIDMWITGYNMPGYMPDAIPSAHESWQEARDVLVWNLDNILMNDYDGDRMEVLKFITLLERTTEPQEVSFNADGYVWWISKE